MVSRFWSPEDSRLTLFPLPPPVTFLPCSRPLSPPTILLLTISGNFLFGNHAKKSCPWWQGYPYFATFACKLELSVSLGPEISLPQGKLGLLVNRALYMVAEISTRSLDRANNNNDNNNGLCDIPILNNWLFYAKTTIIQYNYS